MAVSDISGAVYSEAGLDLAAVDGWIEEHARSTRIRTLSTSRTRICSIPCDVLVLAALEDQVTADNAGRIDAKMVAEGANGPTTVEADAILAERGIVVLPDILTNAGGVTVSYFEWVQDLGRLFWGEGRDPGQARRADR